MGSTNLGKIFPLKPVYAFEKGFEVLDSLDKNSLFKTGKQYFVLALENTFSTRLLKRSLLENDEKPSHPCLTKFLNRQIIADYRQINSLFQCNPI